MTKVGTRVAALRNEGDDGTLYFYGYGVYEGKFPRPGSDEAVPKGEAEIIRTVLTEANTDEHIAKNLHWLSVYFAKEVEQGKLTQEEADQKLQAAKEKAEARRQLPMEQQIKELWQASQENPRIRLEPREGLPDGGIVWGFECWWGPADAFDKKYAGVEKTYVPLPDGPRE